MVILFMLPWAVAMVLLAARIWQAAARPAQPAASVPQPATEPVSNS